MKKKLTQIEAIKYLIKKLDGGFSNYNEWGEAGLWHAVEKIMKNKSWTGAEIDCLYKDAERN